MFKVRVFSDRGFKNDYQYVEANSPEAAVAHHLHAPVTRRYVSDGRLQARVVAPKGEVIDFLRWEPPRFSFRKRGLETEVNDLRARYRLLHFRKQAHLVHHLVRHSLAYCLL